MVATSLAPFKTVSTDPSGCRSSPANSCPLYAFAFVAPGDETRIASTLTRVFEHLFAQPLPALAPGDLTIIPTGSLGGLRVETRWSKASDGTRIVRISAPTPTKTLADAALALADTGTALGTSQAAALRGTQSKLLVTARSLNPAAANEPWVPIDTRSALVRPVEGTDSLEVALYSRGENSPAYVYRIDVTSRGAPTWLNDFDAPNASDSVRTFGLSRLFEAFRQQVATNPLSVARIYFVVN